MEKIKVKIAETAQRSGLKTAYALQKALNISPTIAARLWRGNFDKIGINTLASLCEYFNAQPNEFFEYVTDSSNTDLGNSVTDEASEDETPVDVPVAVIVLDVPVAAPVIDSETWLSTSEVAARLSIAQRTVRDWIKRGKLPARPRQTPQGFSNFIKESDLTAFIEQRKQQE